MPNVLKRKKIMVNSSPNQNNLSPKQKKIAAAAQPKGKITGADFKALKKGKGKPLAMNRKKGM